MAYTKELEQLYKNTLTASNRDLATSGSSSYGESQTTGSTDSYGYSGSSTDSTTTSHTEGGSESHTQGGSSSHTQGGSSSHSQGGSSSQSQGGSTSQSIGGSSSQSQGGSTSQSIGGNSSQSQSMGGNTQYGTSVSRASGQVSNRTQQQFNKATQDYVRSPQVEDAYANLQNALSNKPAFQSKYEDKLNDMYDRIMNREGFSYDFNKDAMYQQYRDMYQQQGKRAMQDTMGQLSAMNNGYGSSYSQTAGQQAYQGYLQQLMDRIPELRQQALDEYEREGNRLNQQYQLTNDQYNREYGQYRDLTGDWQTDRSFNQGAYTDERNFDYTQAQNDRNFWQNEYWQERNAEQTNVNQSQGTNWNQGMQSGTNWSNAQSQNWQDTNSLNWNNSASQNWQDTNSTNWNDTNSSNWQDTNSTNWSDTNSRNWSDSTSNTHTDTTGWNTNHTDSISNTVNQNYQNNWNNGGSSSGRSSSSGSDKVSTVAWSRDNSAGTDYNSANLAKQLYYAYKDGGDEALNEMKDGLKANGLTVGNTKYTFTNADLDELEKKAKIISSQMKGYGYNPNIY